MKRDENSIYLQYLDEKTFLRLSNDPKTHKVDELMILHPPPPEKMRIRKVEKLVTNLNYKKACEVHIKVLNQVLKHGLKLERYTGLLDLNKVIG